LIYNFLKNGFSARSKSPVAALALFVLFVNGCASPSTEPYAGAELESSGGSEAACGIEGKNHESELREIRVGHSGGMLTQAYVEWGEEMGCFEVFGVDPVSVDAGSVEKVAAIVGGSLDIAAESASTTVLAIANGGLDLLFVGGFHEYTAEDLSRALTPSVDEFGSLVLESALLVHPEVDFSGLDKLEGLRIGVSGMDAIATLGLLRAANAEGLGTEDIQFVSAGSSERSAAFEAGELDAVILSGPRANQAMADGAVLAMYPGAYWYEPGPSTVWITDRKHQRDSGELIADFDKGLKATYELLDQPRLREQFKKYLETDWGFESEELETYQIPSLMKSRIELDGLHYLPLKLYEDGLIVGQFQLTPDHLFYAD
jgi:ABC-type nitrate/sulfonate/bicarbonate transport system substrate-binding protein